MRRFHVFLGGYVAVVFLAVDFAWSQAAPDPKLVEGARKEREVVWYTTTNLEPAKRIIDLFQKKYPFLTVNIYRTNVAPLISRVLLRRGPESTDGMFSPEAASFFRRSWKGDLLRSIVLPRRRWSRRTWWKKRLLDGLHGKHLCVDSRIVDKEEVPKTYEQLLEPKWKGPENRRRTTAGMLHGLVPAWGKENALGYFRRLAMQDPVPRDSTSLMAQLLGSGEFPWPSRRRIFLSFCSAKAPRWTGSRSNLPSFASFPQRSGPGLVIPMGLGYSTTFLSGKKVKKS